MGKLIQYEGERFEASPRFGNAIQHLFAQLHPDLEKDDLEYVAEVIMDAVRDECSEQLHPYDPSN